MKSAQTKWELREIKNSKRFTEIKQIRKEVYRAQLLLKLILEILETNSNSSP